jgi:hypothetical protein
MKNDDIKPLRWEWSPPQGEHALTDSTGYGKETDDAPQTIKTSIHLPFFILFLLVIILLSFLPQQQFIF